MANKSVADQVGIPLLMRFQAPLQCCIFALKRYVNQSRFLDQVQEICLTSDSLNAYLNRA